MNNKRVKSTEHNSERIQFMLDRQEEVYNKSPTGTWRQRWIPGICKHKIIRCTHGDEIIGRRWRRKICLVCGRSLKGPIPKECFFTGGDHW